MTATGVWDSEGDWNLLNSGGGGLHGPLCGVPDGPDSGLQPL
jgi:hypothetical protein